MKQKAVFLDRDGVINVDNVFIHKIKDFEFIDGVFNALQKLQQQYMLFIVTNQSGIGRGMYTEDDYQKVNTYMLEQFRNHDIKIQKVYHCPHSPDDGCDCRKPKAKFIEEAVREFDLDPSKSWMIGDKLADIQAGQNAGTNTLLIESRYLQDVNTKKYKNLAEAADFILNQTN